MASASNGKTAALAFACALAAAACATHYTLRKAPASIALQWPFEPAKPKVSYVESWTGLAQSRSFTSAMKAFVYGKAGSDKNAFVLPVAVVTAADGRIAVADLGGRCVHLYLPHERRYLRLTGGKQRPLESPVAVVFDDQLDLFVSDSAGRVVEFGADGAWMRELDRAGEVLLQRPTGLAFSPATGLLFVVDTAASEVHAFRRDGSLAFSFGGRGAEPGAFNYPTHIFRSAAGELYVTDALNFRIEIFDESGKWVGSFGHHGDGSGDLAMPKGLAVDQDGVVYVVDAVFDNVQLFDRKGTFLLTVGARGGQPGEFWLPSGAFVSGRGELLVCDTYNRRIQVFRIAENYAEPTD